MNYILDLFNYNSEESSYLNNTLLNENQHINDNTCYEIDFENSKKIRQHIPDFNDYKFEDKKYYFKVGINIVSLQKINANFYRNINDNTSFYVKTTKPFYFSQDKSKIYVIIYDEDKNIVNKISFNYNVNNQVQYNNDCICVNGNKYKIYLFLTRNNNCDKFHIEKIIYHV